MTIQATITNQSPEATIATKSPVVVVTNVSTGPQGPTGSQGQSITGPQGSQEIGRAHV